MIVIIQIGVISCYAKGLFGALHMQRARIVKLGVQRNRLVYGVDIAIIVTVTVILGDTNVGTIAAAATAICPSLSRYQVLCRAQQGQLSHYCSDPIVWTAGKFRHWSDDGSVFLWICWILGNPAPLICQGHIGPWFGWCPGGRDALICAVCWAPGGWPRPLGLRAGQCWFSLQGQPR